MLLYKDEQILLIRKSCRIVSEVLRELAKHVRPGAATIQLDRIAYEFILARGGRPAFKGYRGYPASICTSVNEQVVHAIPSAKTILKEGDIIGIDVGVEADGYYGDAAVTLPVGSVNGEAARLIDAARGALAAGISKAAAGSRLGDISHAIQSSAESRGFSVVRSFVGHFIGASLHEEPQIPNFGRAGTGPELKPGMVLALEPMLNAGTFEVKVAEDGWTAVTADGKNSAHFEHTVLVTQNHPEILTLES